MKRSAAVTAVACLSFSGTIHSDPMPVPGLGGNFYPDTEVQSSSVTCAGHVLSVRRLETASKEGGVAFKFSVTLDDKELHGAAVTQLRGDLERPLSRLSMSASCYAGVDEVVDGMTLLFSYSWWAAAPKPGEVAIYQEDVRKMCGATKLELDASNPASLQHSRHQSPAAIVVKGVDTKTRLAPRLSYCE